MGGDWSFDPEQWKAGGAMNEQTPDPWAYITPVKAGALFGWAEVVSWESVKAALQHERAASQVREAALHQQLNEAADREIHAAGTILNLTAERDDWEQRFRDYAGIVGEPR